MKKTIVFTIIFIFVFTTFSFTASEYEHILEYTDGVKSYKIISNSELYIKREYVDIIKDYKLRLRNKTSSSYTVYLKVDNEYILESENTSAKDISSNATVIYTNYNVYYGDDVFFSAPKTTQDIIREETAKIPQVLVGQTKTILLHGFGVLSAMLLIMLLVAFWKLFGHRLT